jgi:hypothetical protein
LLDTSSGLVVAPAVIPAANGFPFDPAGGQAAQSMRALIGDDVGLSAFTTVERQLLAEDPDRNDRAPRELLGEVNGLPITAKVAPARKLRACSTTSSNRPNADYSPVAACCAMRAWKWRRLTGKSKAKSRRPFGD